MEFNNLKKKILKINKNHFNQNYIFFNLINNKENSQFLNVIYRSPTIYLDGLCFETPWMKVNDKIINNCYDTNKFLLELIFYHGNTDNEIRKFQNILNNIDKSTINFFNRKNNNFIENKNVQDVYCKNIKYLKKKKIILTEDLDNKKEDLFDNYINSSNTYINSSNTSSLNYDKYDNDYFKRDNLSLKIKFNNNIKITLNNKIIDNLENVNLKNCVVKCDIITYGLWKYNNKIGYSWKGLNLKIMDNNMISIYDNKDYKNRYLKKMKIPNLELYDV